MPNSLDDLSSAAPAKCTFHRCAVTAQACRVTRVKKMRVLSH